jgi:phospholipid-binding lipoprotein MlaA
MKLIQTAPRLPAVLICGLLAGCATTGATPSPSDPWERMNRSTYAFNDALDRALIKPVTKAYQYVAPDFVQTGVSNFLSNLAYTTTIVNDLLQLKLMDALSDTTRLVINTTFGLGGLFDPATRAGLPRNDEDFGQTLGRWGMPSGPYLVLPLLGPSTLRDAPSLYGDYLTDGRHFISNNRISFAFAGLSIVDRRARLMPLESAVRETFDPYAVIRDAYLDRREYRVRDGEVPEQDLGLEEPGQDAEAPGSGTGANN